MRDWDATSLFGSYLFGGVCELRVDDLGIGRETKMYVIKIGSFESISYEVFELDVVFFCGVSVWAI